VKFAAATRESRWLVWTTVLAALLLMLLPLPRFLSLLRPPLLSLVILYWSTMAPRAGGILIGFVAGLLLDLLQGTLLGEHALALSLITYLAVRLHLMTRAKPIFEQGLLVLIGLLLQELVLWAIDGWSGHPLSSWLRWLPCFTGAAIWPVVVGLLGRLHTPR
jgi:rod shape-determining protein MreD